MPSSRVAFVTGAGSGIGRATALRLAADGADLGLFDLSAEGLAATAAELRSHGRRALELVGDVTDPAQVENAVIATTGQLGPLRTAVAAAGVEVLGSAPEIALDDWRRSIDVNLNGVFLTARYAIPWLEDSGGGSFVAISSDAGLQGASGFAAYCAAKHGVIGLVRALALDHGPHGVRCNAVCPGFVETPMAERIFGGLPESERERWRGTVPLGRFGRPEEVADAVAHLTSPQASYVNGHTYVIDGGGTAGYFDS
ncbi:MAG TPA: SDR family NAD(P)-dependent oxidoreductase [Solirubrobacterales bacterium]|nr:SDR family NAD(P)-dependent oxidoreductase [Solirubrobacterales bacterium]